jgi:hypothetical protein
VYEANWRDLRSHVDKLQDPRFSLSLHSIDHPARMDDYVLEFSRLLHNFLSAAQTLVEHTGRAVENLYSDDPFENEFEQKREQILADSGIRHFVTRLRNMVLHRHFPTLTVTRGFDSATSDIALPVEKLRKSYKWDELSLKFMGNADTIEIVALLDDYHSAVQELYDWLGARQLEMHDSDLQRAARVSKALGQHVREGT